MAEENDRKKLISSLIREIPDFPKPGILFRDICPLLKNPVAFEASIDLLTDHIKENYPAVEVIVGLDARGFLFGPGIALKLGIGFVPVRKEGKLPGETISIKSEKEYGKDVLEIQKDSIAAGQKVVIVDDLLATGGTLLTSCELVKKQGGSVLGCVVLFELTELKGAARLPVKCFSLLQS
ncbi:adenine phosphoribosyltransferase-like [Dendronephthya gigantea]|uniref:adenine phosphoribosyltransferase-like n=1 Tax=Dendronephthya gigantea TaxID=151771 RepID=UPI00106CA537|nr:adenine phosphoribosyltransferase-like [Dendronephthya gigantea]